MPHTFINEFGYCKEVQCEINYPNGNKERLTKVFEVSKESTDPEKDLEIQIENWRKEVGPTIINVGITQTITTYTNKGL